MALPEEVSVTVPAAPCGWRAYASAADAMQRDRDVGEFVGDDPEAEK